MFGKMSMNYKQKETMGRSAYSDDTRATGNVTGHDDF